MLCPAVARRLTCQALFGFLLALISSVGSSVAAQTNYEIEGSVYTPNYAPIAGVVVILENQARARIGQAITDSNGRYHFSRVTAGVYYITVKPNEKEFQSISQKVELIDTGRGGNNISVEVVNFVLTPTTQDLGKPGVVFAQEVPLAAEREYQEAMKLSLAGKLDQAISRLERALMIFPDYFAALQQLGLLHIDKNESQKALAPLRKAISINPQAPLAHLALGIACVNLSQFELAIESLERAIALNAKSFRSCLYLGIALLNLNRLQEAEANLKEAYKLGGPERASQAHLYLASLYNKQGRYREAIRELETFLRENPKATNAERIREAIARLKSKG